jgi:hypothetical protein
MLHPRTIAGQGHETAHAVNRSHRSAQTLLQEGIQTVWIHFRHGSQGLFRVLGIEQAGRTAISHYGDQLRTLMVFTAIHENKSNACFLEEALLSFEQ